MFCLQCGAKNDDDSRFCYRCGTPLMKRSEPDRKKKKFQEEVSGGAANDFVAEKETTNADDNSGYDAANENTMPDMDDTVSNMYGMPDGNGMQNMNDMYGYPQQGVERQAAPRVLTGGRAFGIMCLNLLHCIPILGTLAWLIIMLIFACSGKKDPNRAGMCRGVLIWFFVPVIIITILLLIFGSSISAVLSEAGLI